MCFPSCRWKGRTVSEPPWTLWSWRDREASPSSQLLHTQCGRITTSTSLTHQVLNIVLDVESFVGNMLHMTPNDWPPLCGRFAGSALKKKKKKKRKFSNYWLNCMSVEKSGEVLLSAKTFFGASHQNIKRLTLTGTWLKTPKNPPQKNWKEIYKMSPYSLSGIIQVCRIL